MKKKDYKGLGLCLGIIFGAAFGNILWGMIYGILIFSFLEKFGKSN